MTTKTIPLPENLAALFAFLGERQLRVEAEEKALNSEKKVLQMELQQAAGLVHTTLNIPNGATAKVDTDKGVVIVEEPESPEVEPSDQPPEPPEGS